MRWTVRVASILPPLVLSAAGLAVALPLENSAPHWPTALAGWVTAWFFALVAIAGWEVMEGRRIFGRPGREQPRWRRSEVIALAALLLAASALRFAAIESYPVALHNDEMSCLIEARQFLGGDPEIFGLGWFNCPNLGFFLTSLPVRFLGQTILGLRFGSAVFGVLSLLAAYPIVRRLFGVRPAMLLLVMTTPFHWHLHFSRAGFHYMQSGSLTAVAILLFVVGVGRRSPVLFGCAGVATGIACQTYYASWLIPLLLVAWTLARLASDRDAGKIAVKGLAVATLLFAVTLAPLLAHYANRPFDAFSRPNAVYLFSDYNREHLASAYGTSDPLRLLAMNALQVGGLFVGTHGDSSLQYGLQGQFIDPFLLPLFLGGLVSALTLVRSPGGQLLWIWFLGTLVAGGLLTIDAPFSPRLIGITAIVLLFPALLIDRIFRLPWIAERRWSRRVLAIATGLLLAGSAWWNLDTTFVRYPKNHWYEARDYIIRLALELDHVRTIVNFAVHDNFDHEAYLALIPHIERANFDHWDFMSPKESSIVEALGPRALVILPPVRTSLDDLINPDGVYPSGTVVAPRGFYGFKWVFIED